MTRRNHNEDESHWNRSPRNPKVSDTKLRWINEKEDTYPKQEQYLRLDGAAWLDVLLAFRHVVPEWSDHEKERLRIFDRKFKTSRVRSLQVQTVRYLGYIHIWIELGHVVVLLYFTLKGHVLDYFGLNLSPRARWSKGQRDILRTRQGNEFGAFLVGVLLGLGFAYKMKIGIRKTQVILMMLC